MVQPVRLVLGISALLSIASLTTAARAEPVPSSCRTGLVLGVAEADAQDVVVAVCSAAKARRMQGLVRVSVLAAGDRVRIGVAHLTDTTRDERTVHAEGANIAAAINIAPGLLDPLDSTSTPYDGGPASPAPAPAPARALGPAAAPAPPPASAPPSPPPSSPSSSSSSTSPSTAAADSDGPDPKDRATSALEAKAGPPAAMLGVHGSSGVAGGATGFGGGASIGVDHRSAQGFIDYSNSSASATKVLEHELLTIGARLKLSQSSAFKPVIGGGWSYVDYKTKSGATRTSGQGIGVFGEIGAIYALQKHQLMALARWNIGLYDEQRYTETTYTTGDGQTYPTTMSSGGRDALSSSFAFLAGYGYVFR